MMRKTIVLIIMCLPLLTMAQTSNENKTEGGIKWATGLSWEQIKQKAKTENKYIFIDGYTTWCKPCKMMDKFVYPNDTVGDFFNEHFIAVKVQMDVTDNDEQPIRDWYTDSKQIQGEYAVTAYPSLIFLSPESIPLYKIEGYRPPKEFVDTAKLVLTSGTVYNDPYKEYRVLVSEYKHGIKHYDRMPYMIYTAGRLNDNDFARELFKDHVDYASRLNETERYTKQNIELWSSFVLKLDSKAFQFFFKDGDKIDQVMGEKGYSTDVVDVTIQKRIVDSFFRMQKGLTTIIDGTKVPNSEIMFMKLAQRRDGKINPDYVEADWKKLKKMIREHFSEDYAIRNVFKAKMVWYNQHQNKLGVSKTYFSLLDKYPPPDLTKELLLNQISWETFLYVNDKMLLKKALEWMNKLLRTGDSESNKLDTYANLLYKLGRTREAIQWEEKAVSAQAKNLGKNEDNEFKPILEKMKKGEPTYLEQGAIWPEKK